MYEEELKNENTDVNAVSQVEPNEEENNVVQMQEKTDEDYLNEINKLQEEYKQYQAAKKAAIEKQKKEEEQKNKKGISLWLSILISCAASVLIFAILFSFLAFFPSKDESLLAGFFKEDTKITQNTITGTPGSSTEIGGETIEPGDNVTIEVESNSIAAAVYAKASNSVVGIEVTRISGGNWNRTETTVSQGSGIIYASDGIIVTNYHVIESAVNSKGLLDSSYNIYAYFNTKLTQYTNEVTLLGFDAASDIAVLRFKVSKLVPIEFADSDEITIGEQVVAIGSPGGLDFMNSVSEGIISGTNRALASETDVVYDLLQTTAAINPGNSGGALLNSEGKLIGICVMKIGGDYYEGMGFAINSNTVKKIVESIREYGFYNKPQLGVTIDTSYNMALAKQNGWPLGAAVSEVAENSCAEKAGIKANDIITSINDVKIETFIDLRTELLKYSPGTSIKITLYRTDNDSTKTVHVTLDPVK